LLGGRREREGVSTGEREEFNEASDDATAAKTKVT
jgi:hypothetical protein